MEQNQQSPEVKDRALWQLAKKRAAFKSHLYVYLVINCFIWAVWFFTGRDHYNTKVPWPAWTTIGWGLGLAFHYANTYLFPGNHSIEKEYQKLKNKQNVT